ncbi:MAG TPA: phosphoribosylamine--glycine ligase N-terminal domain-containing protein, partial [Gemmatimonadaceae bacterium]|nr:phosphoribosylamine--glycine ligase N-terminal domain-containing protein [Gemmatimonadaceae bacterium]
MRVLVVGSGAREHAIVWKLGRDDPQLELHAAPGNPGIAEGAECHSVTATDISGLVALARRLDPDLVVVGPEAPLAAGIGDALRDAGIAVFGPSAAAARIEASKRFA